LSIMQSCAALRKSIDLARQVSRRFALIGYAVYLHRCHTCDFGAQLRRMHYVETATNRITVAHSDDDVQLQMVWF